MITKRIITNYTINDQDVSTVNETKKQIPKIIKNSSVNEKMHLIDLSKEGDTVKPSNENKKEIRLNKDVNGFVTSIDVICGCGEKFTIKLEY